MIGVNTTYVVQVHDDIWSQVFTTDDVDEAKYYVQTKRGNGKQYRIVKYTEEVL